MKYYTLCAFRKLAGEALKQKIKEQEDKGAPMIDPDGVMPTTGASMAIMAHNLEDAAFAQWICTSLEGQNPDSNDQYWFTEQGEHLHQGSCDECTECRNIILSKIAEGISKEHGGVAVKTTKYGSKCGTMRMIPLPPSRTEQE